jgi:hypothetical protein
MVADVNGFYKYTIVGPTSVNIIFNNGSTGSANQTLDLLNKTNGYSYTWGGAARMSDGDENLLSQTIVYPNPVIDILQIGSVSEIYSYKILNIQGSTLKEGQPNENAIDMSEFTTGLYFLQLKDKNGAEVIRRVLKK